MSSINVLDILYTPHSIYINEKHPSNLTDENNFINIKIYPNNRYTDISKIEYCHNIGHQSNGIYKNVLTNTNNLYKCISGNSLNLFSNLNSHIKEFRSDEASVISKEYISYGDMDLIDMYISGMCSYLVLLVMLQSGQLSHILPIQFGLPINVDHLDHCLNKNMLSFISMPLSSIDNICPQNAVKQLILSTTRFINIWSDVHVIGHGISTDTYTRLCIELINGITLWSCQKNNNLVQEYMSLSNKIELLEKNTTYHINNKIEQMNRQHLHLMHDFKSNINSYLDGVGQQLTTISDELNTIEESMNSKISQINNNVDAIDKQVAHMNTLSDNIDQKLDNICDGLTNAEHRYDDMISKNEYQIKNISSNALNTFINDTAAAVAKTRHTLSTLQDGIVANIKRDIGEYVLRIKWPHIKNTNILENLLSSVESIKINESVNSSLSNNKVDKILFKNTKNETINNASLYKGELLVDHFEDNFGGNFENNFGGNFEENFEDNSENNFPESTSGQSIDDISCDLSLSNKNRNRNPPTQQPTSQSTHQISKDIFNESSNRSANNILSESSNESANNISNNTEKLQYKRFAISNATEDIQHHYSRTEFRNGHHTKSSQQGEIPIPHHTTTDITTHQSRDMCTTNISSPNMPITSPSQSRDIFTSNISSPNIPTTSANQSRDMCTTNISSPHIPTTSANQSKNNNKQHIQENITKGGKGGKGGNGGKGGKGGKGENGGFYNTIPRTITIIPEISNRKDVRYANGSNDLNLSSIFISSSDVPNPSETRSCSKNITEISTGISDPTETASNSIAESSSNILDPTETNISNYSNGSGVSGRSDMLVASDASCGSIEECSAPRYFGYSDELPIMAKKYSKEHKNTNHVTFKNITSRAANIGHGDSKTSNDTNKYKFSNINNINNQPNNGNNNTSNINNAKNNNNTNNTNINNNTNSTNINNNTNNTNNTINWSDDVKLSHPKKETNNHQKKSKTTPTKEHTHIEPKPSNTIRNRNKNELPPWIKRRFNATSHKSSTNTSPHNNTKNNHTNNNINSNTNNTKNNYTSSNINNHTNNNINNHTNNTRNGINSINERLNTTYPQHSNSTERNNKSPKHIQRSEKEAIAIYPGYIKSREHRYNNETTTEREKINFENISSSFSDDTNHDIISQKYNPNHDIISQKYNPNYDIIPQKYNSKNQDDIETTIKFFTIA